MGIKGIRTALKVDLDKPARDQPGLHVRESMNLACEQLLIRNQ